ncbi:flagellar basal body rod protein FlgC [Vibrio alginolyticus]|uniref:flagellar basal body rod protein FlgC n=1 Tax=Vibrio sp. B1FLJ16 TaxID=2751178 RepID=UPI0015F6F788|nr:flagellar basal body rod protein FlgC [Vibrio sp. B1FLJ16]MCA0936750.1 flagellar basal body rod protein FlgC [Vibrio alginolyticus]CAD7822048.1 Belongs to the flagella basal body rod proteins family [Vibrio sp. B1FLJ16]CAD7823592.1 Belongs to the flagella basal body rod proteins family [Vibrio sp. B1FLJ16]CAE6947928.1 Belongs to the flagella basal body rod proteins family [Vibrio sp. B1FLJ16]CAE6952294.1 Belongs to the flagella basal body rod proteins family [Vibrio sp. B1FLJ16]
MSFTDIYSIAGSAMNAQTVRLNTVASNLANADAVSANPDDAYKALKPVFATVYGKSQLAMSNDAYPSAEVKIVDVVQSAGEAEKRFEPSHPLANDEGYVYYPDIDVVSEMADMMSATRSFETNVEVLANVKSMQQGLLKLGQGS